MLNKISMQGIVRYQRKFEIVGREDTTLISNAIMKFDGYKLDELQLTAVLKNVTDFDELIRLLEVHKRCFYRPTEQTT